MTWRAVLGLMCVAGLIMLSRLDLDAGDDPAASVAVLALPLVTAALVGRPWILGVALVPLALYIFDRDTGELSPAFFLSTSVFALAVMAALGLLANRLWNRWHARRRGGQAASRL